jgi:hypothetical protein
MLRCGNLHHPIRLTLHLRLVVCFHLAGVPSPACFVKSLKSLALLVNFNKVTFNPIFWPLLLLLVLWLMDPRVSAPACLLLCSALKLEFLLTLECV